MVHKEKAGNAYKAQTKKASLEDVRLKSEFALNSWLRENKFRKRKELGVYIIRSGSQRIGILSAIKSGGWWFKPHTPAPDPKQLAAKAARELKAKAVSVQSEKAKANFIQSKLKFPETKANCCHWRLIESVEDDKTELCFIEMKTGDSITIIEKPVVVKHTATIFGGGLEITVSEKYAPKFMAFIESLITEKS